MKKKNAPFFVLIDHHRCLFLVLPIYETKQIPSCHPLEDDDPNHFLRKPNPIVERKKPYLDPYYDNPVEDAKW